MANSRFVRAASNRTTNVAATIRNTPPEDAQYPSSNLLNNDRYSVWATGSGASGNIVVQIDMNSSQTVRIVGVLGLRAAVSGAMPTAINFGYRTSGQGYSSDPAQYTAYGTIPAALDSTLEVTPVAMQYLQFTFVSPGSWSNGFSLGNLLAAATILDLGAMYSPGSEETVVTPQIRVRTQVGIPIIEKLGSSYMRFVHSYRNIDDTMLGNIASVAAETDPFTYLRALGGTFHCLPSVGEWRRRHVWAPGNVWDALFEFEQLP